LNPVPKPAPLREVRRFDHARYKVPPIHVIKIRRCTIVHRPAAVNGEKRGKGAKWQRSKGKRAKPTDCVRGASDHVESGPETSETETSTNRVEFN
jgi:hypothetical protein